MFNELLESNSVTMLAILAFSLCCLIALVIPDCGFISY